MFSAVALLLLGLFAATRSVDFENKKFNKRLITLRDYDFVGEDKRLAAVLATRMALLRVPLNLSDLDARMAARGQPPAPGPPGEQDLRPDYDYPQRELGLPHPSNASELNEAPPGLISRRGWWVGPSWKYPGKVDVNNKVMDMMRQTIYAAQRKMYEIHGTISKYEWDVRYRMAFIFRRLDEWKHEARTALHACLRYRYYRFRAAKQIWYYEHILRKNIDITYSIEHLLYLHTMYMERMKAE